MAPMQDLVSELLIDGMLPNVLKINSNDMPTFLQFNNLGCTFTSESSIFSYAY